MNKKFKTGETEKLSITEVGLLKFESKASSIRVSQTMNAAKSIRSNEAFKSDFFKKKNQSETPFARLLDACFLFETDYIPMSNGTFQKCCTVLT